MLDTNTNEEFSLINLMTFIAARWKMITILVVVAGLLSALFSSPLFITPLYRSYVILYPASTGAISKSLLNESTVQEQDIMELGEDVQTEQMLQILGSTGIRDRIIRHFKLAEHYGIDSASSNFRSRLYRQYEDLIRCKRTEYMGVKVSVLDSDPRMAADIANAIPAMFDSVKNDMQKERAVQALRIVEAEYIKLKGDIEATNDSLSKLRELGVQDYESQAERLNQQLAIETARGNRSAVKALEEKLKVLARYGSPYLALTNFQEFQMEQLNFVKSKYDEAHMDAFSFIPQKFVVQEAFRAERKSYPVQSLVIMLSCLATFLVSVMVLMLAERIKKENSTPGKSNS